MRTLKKIKFEHIFSIMILIILTAALFIFKDIEEVRTTVITAMVGALSAVTAFFFTKHQVGIKSDDKESKEKSEHTI